MFTFHSTFLAAAAAGLALAGQLGPAKADVLNTYNGAECVAINPSQERNLRRFFGVAAVAPTDVLCPIVKAIANSTAGVTVAVAASGGTRCRLESYDVFTTSRRVTQQRTFPGFEVSGLAFTLDSTNRGAMQLRCGLQAGDEVRNYLVREE